jgi:hypothetical protein
MQCVDVDRALFHWYCVDSHATSHVPSHAISRFAITMTFAPVVVGVAIGAAVVLNYATPSVPVPILILIPFCSYPSALSLYCSSPAHSTTLPSTSGVNSAKYSATLTSMFAF